MSEIWILGATGRVGAAVATRLAAASLPLVLVGRDAARLQALAAALPGPPRIVVADGAKAAAAALAGSQATVVLNTIGPFGETAGAIVDAGPPGAHYLDLSNDLDATTVLLGRHDAATAAGRTLVTGAGFGVLAAESVLMQLCAGRPAAARARVDLIPALDSEAGLMGAAFAATVVDIIATGGRRYENSRLVRAGLGDDGEALTLPGGEVVHTGGGPSGELEMARRVSGAPFVVAASTAAPAGPMRAIVPALSALMRVPAVGRFATRRLAAVRTKVQPRPRPFSWARARVEWASGEKREGWLRAGECMAFTADVAAEVARRLALGEGRPGAYTPGELFGPGLAESVGGQFILDA